MNEITQPTFLEHAIVALFMGISLFSVLRAQPRMKGQVFSTSDKLSTYWGNGIALIIGAAIVIAAWFLAGRSAEDLGLAWNTHGPLALGLIALFVAWYVAEACYRLTGTRRGESIVRMKRNTPFMPTSKRELRHWTFLALCAGICEEIIFRGFLISYLVSFTGDSPLGVSTAVVVPGLYFAVVHLYQGWRTVGWIFLMSVLFGAVFVLTGSLWLLMLLHFLVDQVGGFMTVKVMAGEPPQNGPAPADLSHRELVDA